MLLSVHYPLPLSVMVNRSLLVVMAVGAAALISVALAGFGAPNFNHYYAGRTVGAPNTFLQKFAALLAPEPGSTAACPVGYSWQPIGQTQSEPPTILYDCVPDQDTKTACVFYACGHADCEGSVMPVSCTDPRCNGGPCTPPGVQCLAWPTCLKALVPAGCTCVAPTVGGPGALPECPSDYELLALPGETDVYPPRYTYTCVPKSTKIITSATDTTSQSNSSVDMNVSSPGPSPTPLSRTQPARVSPASTPPVSAVTPTPATSVLRRFVQLPPASSLAPLPALPETVLSEPTPPEPAHDDSSWFTRLRQSLVSLWQRLF